MSSRVPRSTSRPIVGVVCDLLAIAMLMIAAVPAEAAAAPPASHVASAGILMGTQCYAFHQKKWYADGYTEIDVGACYDTTTWHPTLQWGPYCPSFWWNPAVRATLNYCGWYYDSQGGITVYGGWWVETWVPFIGWTWGHEDWEQYGI